MKTIKQLSEHNFLVLAILWTVSITVASLVSLTNVPKVAISGNDKVVHFIFYAVFVILWGLAKSKSFFKLKLNLLIVLIAILYGIIIEVLQSTLTTSREADFYDVLANSLGAIFGFVCQYYVKNKIFNKFF